MNSPASRCRQAKRWTNFSPQKPPHAGARRHYGSLSKTVEDQLKKELTLIQRPRFRRFTFSLSPDIVNYARQEDILVQGTRVAPPIASSCYVLGITRR